ncbi:TraR/DksA family transcriptional regulator [uncultured Roseovarius sp.]|uniref:TraR/DksA family transcriptional regulator n=1 Tax=uncultured Roseovarius sp. TaxID=293344 RepID=UPI00262D8416|nr:TraR/DksA family transcriptional regulator [uncultured Roseovarius sp.]
MDLERQKTVLQKRRNKLTADLTKVENSLDETPSKDWEDRSSERQGDEVLESLGMAELAELRRVDAALTRVADGTYGDCQQCGEQISAARLELLPDTPFCKSCAL